MTTNEPIKIFQCQNGFIVSRNAGHDEWSPIEGNFVFQTMAELIQFLAHHFDHRAQFVKGDDCTKLSEG